MPNSCIRLTVPVVAALMCGFIGSSVWAHDEVATVQISPAEVVIQPHGDAAAYTLAVSCTHGQSFQAQHDAGQALVFSVIDRCG